MLCLSWATDTRCSALRPKILLFKSATRGYHKMGCHVYVQTDYEILVLILKMDKHWAQSNFYELNQVRLNKWFAELGPSWTEAKPRLFRCAYHFTLLFNRVTPFALVKTLEISKFSLTVCALMIQTKCKERVLFSCLRGTEFVAEKCHTNWRTWENRVQGSDDTRLTTVTFDFG